MKRLLTLAAMFLCSLATSFAQFSGSGSGTESDPYLITQPLQLNQLRNYLNQENVYFKLMANFDLTEYLEDESPTQGWQPVGNSSSAVFKGILDGNGKTVSGLWINRGSTDYVGLFGYTSGATIKNLTIVANTIVGKDNVGVLSGYGDNSTYTGVNITTTKIQGDSKVGGLVGNTGDNMNLSDNTIAAVINATGDYVGGLIGKNAASYNLSISGCQVNDSKIIGNNYVGGACGGITGGRTLNKISTCYIHADITGNNRVGGICGFSESDHIVNLTNCGYIGNIFGTAYIGGLIGYVKRTNTVNNDLQNGCFAIGSISGTSDYVAGLIGYDSGYSYFYNDVINCYFSGSVLGRNYTAGLVGYKKYGTISNSYCSASVLGNQYVGGLVGYQDAYTSLKTSVAINTRVYATEGDVNRIVGYNMGTIAAVGSAEENKSYNRTIIVSQGVAKDIEDDLLNGSGVSATTLKLKATYVAMDWDFTDTWAIQEIECYPYFKSQTAPPLITSDVVSGATTISGNCVNGATVTLEIDGVKQQKVFGGSSFSFSVEPLQAGHEVRVSAKAEGKEQSYYTIALVSYLGKGTESDPYQVYTAADLTGVYRKGYYKQMNDIDLSDYINQYSPTEGWQSIGRDGSETIHFDGDGHKISGLWCNSTRDNTGLFSCFADGSIKNLTVETASGKQVKGGNNTGILIGKMINGTITNCRVSGTVADGTPVGGIVGLLDGGKISLSQANVTINTTGKTSYVGGLVGDITSGEIDQCVTLGTLTATGTESYVGGLVGKNSATVTNCYSNADVNSSYNAAGLIAYNYGLVDKCYATGNLFSNNYGAGVIGYNDGSSAVVKNCVAMNNKIDVTYESQSAQGGGYGQRIIGGIKNSAPAPEMNNYALKTMQVSVNDLPQMVYDDIMNGVAKAGTELLKQATYQELGWSFTDVWSIAEGDSYPSLKKNAATVVGPPVIVTANSYTIEYGDDLPTFEYTCDGTISGTPTITCEATKTSPVGTYPIVISKGSVTNNNVTYVYGTLTITKAPLKITAKDYTIKQGQALPTFEATYEGFKNNETSAVLTKQPTITTTATSASALGEYEITIGGAEAKNYSISYFKGKLTITEADPVTITAKSYTIEYGDNLPMFGYTSEGATLTGTPSITCEATKTSRVGIYTIVVKKGSVKNYNVTYVNGILIIKKAPLKITAKDYTIKQGQALPTFEATYESFKNNETANVLTKQPTITTTATSSSVPGEYEITVSGAEAKNYAISYFKGKLTITEANPVTITAKSYTIKYGDELPTFEFTSEGATLEGTPAIACEATKISAVGTYPIVITKGSVTNYNTTFVNGTLTIEKAPLTITAKSYTIKQGETLPTFEAEYSGFKNNETKAVLTTQPTITTTATSTSESGEYDIIVSGAEAQNYSISYVAGKLTITESDGIRKISSEHPVSVFDIQGHKVRSNVTSLEGLPKGVYIINGRKVVVK